MQAQGGVGVMLPYKFQIVSFIDNRPEEETASYTGEIGQNDAFPQHIFTNALQENLSYSLYGNKRGTVALTLTHYKLTEYKRDFTLSLQMHLLAKTDLNEVIVDETFTCAQDKYRAPQDIPRMVKDGWHSQSIAPFTKQGWHNEITQELVATCAQNVAQRFAQSALNGVMNSKNSVR